MIILHLHWQPPSQVAETGLFCFWAEDSAAPSPSLKIDRRRREALPHPFALGQAQLAAHLKSLTGVNVRLQRVGIALRLPTTRRGPQPSPQLLHDWEVDTTDLRLFDWEIPALVVSPADGFYLLNNLPPATELSAQERLGDDLVFWQVTSRLALEAVAQQKVLPDVAAGQKGGAKSALHARWRAVLDGPRDGPRLARLRQSMPPLCRADASVANHDASPRLLLDSFLNSVVDGLMRRWSGSHSVDNSSDNQLLQALTNSSNAQIQASAAQGQQIQVGHRAWLRNLYAAGDVHFRVALRLEAPVSGNQGDDWTLYFLLQSREDPSLLIEAAQVWQRRPPSVANLQNPQELLLTGLGFAARQSEAVRSSLQGKQPMQARLSPDDAYAYLRHTAPLLEESGFGVLVPPWWNKPNARLGLRVRMKGSGNASDGVASGLLTMENLIRYEWQLSVGGQEIDFEEFQALVDLKSPLVQIRGQWVQLDPEQIEAAIRFWQRQETEDEFGLLDAAGLVLDGATVDGLDVEGIDAEGWVKDWLDRFTGQDTLDLLADPPGLNATLRPYQRYGYSWLDFQRRWGVGVCLADDMGLGKTIQTLAMLSRAKDAGETLPGPTLLIAPTSVVVNWAKEAERFTPNLRVLVHQGPDRLREDDFIAAAREHDIVATSYALVRRDEDFLKQIAWFGIVLDEAQNIKNADTKQARVIRHLGSRFRL
ncbi:MAG: DEAD/DEAH box helicase, partial [Caldilineaceae bacterium]|nr:DEAD/DEAH box helicase [Caldilineaceae bacterium]